MQLDDIDKYDEQIERIETWDKATSEDGYGVEKFWDDEIQETYTMLKRDFDDDFAETIEELLRDREYERVREFELDDLAVIDPNYRPSNVYGGGMDDD